MPVLVGGMALVLLFVWLERRPLEPGEVEATAPGEVVGETGAGALPEGAGDGRPKPRPAPLSAPSERALVKAVKEWAAAWSEQRVDDYLGCYSRSFAPEQGISRGQWQAERRLRISAPRFVRVSITGLETEITDPGTARATFLQHYRSDSHTDTVGKTLYMVSEDGRWRIQRESSERAP